MCALIGPSCPARFDLLTKMSLPPVSSRMNEQRFGSKGYYCERETKYRDTLNKRHEKRNKMLKKMEYNGRRDFVPLKLILLCRWCRPFRWRIGVTGRSSADGNVADERFDRLWNRTETYGFEAGDLFTFGVAVGRVGH